MKTKNIIFNVLMVLAIIVIAIGGIVFVYNLKSGKSVTDASNVSVQEKFGIVTNTKGNVRIERKGIGYSLLKDTVIVKNDIVTTLDKSNVEIDTNNMSKISIDENSEFSSMLDDGKQVYNLVSGNVFVNASSKEKMLFSWEKGTISASDCVFSFSVREGVPSFNVYYGDIEILSKQDSNKLEATKSQTAFVSSNGKIVTSSFNTNSLSEFDIKNANKIADKSLCFTSQELQQTLDKRAQDVEKAIKAKQEQTNKLKEKGNKEDVISIVDSQTSSTNKVAQSKDKEITSSQEDKNQAAINDKDVVIEDKNTTINNSSTSNIMTATIVINCSNILKNMDKLKSGLDIYVPDDGVILNAVTVEFTKGETAFDVLKRVCDARDIQMEYLWYPIYNSHYIQGINHLYEKNCGDGSGWVYAVNGWRPNYGVSVYKLKDGDYISFDYTCDLGNDV